MEQKLYKTENNLFQSPEWLAFQQSYGRHITEFDGFSGISLDLPFGKQGIWTQKAPVQHLKLETQNLELSAGTIFIRVEPSAITESEINGSKLRLVTKASLLSGQASPKATRVLGISESEEEILAQMKPKTRYNIRLAEKKGVVVKEADSADVFYSLLVKTAERDKGYAPHAKEYYQKMLAELGSKGLVKIFIAEHEGEPLAAIMVSFYGEVATYLHGGFNDTKRNLMAPYLCQWEAIKSAKQQGCAYYDFWGVAATDNPNDTWAGISRFKEGFGGEKIVFPGSYDIIVNSFWYHLLTLAAKIKHILRRNN